MADLLGQQLGNYHLTRLLGQGGFADVYLGEHIHLHTQAAIKLLHTRLGSENIEGFRKEARTIASLDHPHIVRVLDFGVEGSIPFLVMYYASNGTLRHRHPKGTQLPLELVIMYVKQMAAASQYAHNQHLIHRDVKPENMLVGKNGEILLGDFGIALMTQSSRPQSTTNVVGTAAYMAPEQLDGKPVPASDQYALGIVMYEWLTLKNGLVLPSFVPTPTSTPTRTPVPSGTALYQADWSNNSANGWSIGGPWRILNRMLADDGSNNSTNSVLIAPYQPQSSNYAVDATIQFNRSTDQIGADYYIFGVVIVSNGNSNGYACQLDVVYPNAPAVAAIVPVSDTSGNQDGTYDPITPLASRLYNANPAKAQTFHIEVRGPQITFFIDGIKLLQIPNGMVSASDIHMSGEYVGLIDVSVDINVSSFKVTAL